MNEIRLLYNVVSKVLDRNRPWYDPANNTLYIKDATFSKYHYFLEADTYSPENGKKLYIILSEDKIDSSCRPCYYDDYGRLKIKPVVFKEYFQSVHTVRTNIKLSVDDRTDEYVALEI